MSRIPHTPFPPLAPLESPWREAYDAFGELLSLLDWTRQAAAGEIPPQPGDDPLAHLAAVWATCREPGTRASLLQGAAAHLTPLSAEKGRPPVQIGHVHGTCAADALWRLGAGLTANGLCCDWTGRLARIVKDVFPDGADQHQVVAIWPLLRAGQADAGAAQVRNRLIQLDRAGVIRLERPLPPLGYLNRLVESFAGHDIHEVIATVPVAEVCAWLREQLGALDAQRVRRELQLEFALVVHRPNSPPDRLTGNSIRLVGEVWFLHYQDEEGAYPEKGNLPLSWLAKLLAAPGRHLTVAHLRGDPEEKLKADAMTKGEEVTDAEGQKRIRDRLEDIEDVCQITGGSEALEQERDDLLRRLKEAGKPLQTYQKRRYDTLAAQLRNLPEKLAGRMPRLAAHLKGSFDFAFPHLCYKPSSDTAPWQF
jgi:hypothetical protein